MLEAKVRGHPEFEDYLAAHERLLPLVPGQARGGPLTERVAVGP